MNIVLVGYRGSGKSTVARLLAAELNRPSVSLDERIVERAGRSIPDIVAAHGWDHFRELESRAVLEVAEQDGLILDTGGGVILRQENVARLRRNGWVVWLTAPPEVLAERIRGDDQRPALTAGRTFLEEVHEVLREREPLYRAAANARVDVSEISPAEVCARIRELLPPEEDASGVPQRHG